jgi:hypothetical protein
MSDKPLYICIDCELSNSEADPTPLNEHGYCPRCGSTSVVPVDTLRELDAKRKREAQAPLESTANAVHRFEAMKAQRKRDAEPLVSWLKESFCDPKNPLTTLLYKTLEEWDGWAWHVFYPWDEGEGYFVVELVQGVKNGPRWLIKIDATLVEVKSFQDGTIKQ